MKFHRHPYFPLSPKRYPGCLALLLFFTSCNKAIDVGMPPTEIVAGSAFNSDGGAESVLAGLYVQLAQDGFTYGEFGLSIMMGLYADELGCYNNVSPIDKAFCKDSLTSQSDADEFYWGLIYKLLYTCNTAIEGNLLQIRPKK